MPERIDFALEPGVVVFAILFFVLINVLLAAVLYPYLRDSSPTDSEEVMGDGRSDEDLEESPTDEGSYEERVDEFLRDIHGEESH